MLALSLHTPSYRKSPAWGRPQDSLLSYSGSLKPSFMSLAEAATVGLGSHVRYSLFVTGITPVRANSVHHTTPCLSRRGEQIHTIPELPQAAHGSWPGQNSPCGHKRKVSACAPIPSFFEKDTPTHLCQISTQSQQLLPGTAWFRDPFPGDPPSAPPSLRPCWPTDTHNALPTTLPPTNQSSQTTTALITARVVLVLPPAP